HPRPSVIYTLSLHDALPIWVLSAAANGIGRGITAIKGDIAPEVAKKIATSESMGVTPMTSDVIPPKNAFTRGLTQDAEGALLGRSEEHTSELQSRFDLVCRL